MSPAERILLAEQIIRRGHRLEEALTLLIADKESWNANRIHDEPFDLGWERVALAKVRECNAAWLAQLADDNEVTRARHSALMDQLVEIMQAAEIE